jgi:CBS domain containing-hemolysin-like protein
VRETKKTALWLAYPLRVFFLIFKPIIWLLNSMANWTLRLVGLKTANEAELRHSEEELRLLLAQDDKASTASRDIALRAMDFRKKQGRHIMIPRKEIVALWIGDSLAENVNIMRSHKYSRYPVYAENLDHILGIVHTKDIFKFDKHLDSGFKLESVLRDALFIPETVPIDRILTTMLQKKNHMVLLADEYGSTAGLITLEDVIEELVGAIQDEFDKEKPEVVQVSADEYVIDAALTTNDVERLLGRELSQNDILSIGGLVTEQLGHFPQRGESVEINSIQFIIEQTGERTVDTIRVKRLPIRQINTNE